MRNFIESESGDLTIFHPPEPGMVYTVGIDAATGLGNDYTAIQVLWNAIPFAQCAVYRSNLPPVETTRAANNIGLFYNEALIICETNYPGNSVQDNLLNFYNYPRNYRAEQHLDEDPTISSKYGFRTTEPSKWMLIHELQNSLERNEILIYDDETLNELLNFVYVSGKNKAGAADGFNDDLVMSLMLALHGASLYPCAKPIVDRTINANKSKDPQTIKDWDRIRSRLRNRLLGNRKAQLLGQL